MTDMATPENDLEILSWRVQGMDCAACVAKVEKAVKRLTGVSTVQVSLMAERLTISRTSKALRRKRSRSRSRLCGAAPNSTGHLAQL